MSAEKREQRAHAGGELEEIDLDQVRRRLDVDTAQGLAGDAVEQRLARYGPNDIAEKEKSTLRKLVGHFWGPIPWMIEVAALLALVAQRWEDFGVIFTMLLINGGVGFWHENKADKAIEKLKETMAPRARVLRGGALDTIDARQLVPGDVIELRMGDVVPADARLLEDQRLHLDESALTGESLPVDKDPGAVLYSSTTVKRGEGRALVVATGGDTEFARTVELVASAEQKSHFQKAVLRIGYFLISVTALLVLVIVLYTLLVRDDPWTQVLLFALGLTLAGIPQALPAVMSVTMSVGASRLARKKAIVSRLAAMEEMAGLQVLCADKTGTLTRNRLELQQPVVLEAEDERDLLRAAALASRTDHEDDPIDAAIAEALPADLSFAGYQVIEFNDFDPTRKRADATVECGGERFQVAKGAPQVILQLTEADQQRCDEIKRRVQQLGQEGFRALGVGRNRGEGWVYLGILPLLDPPRDDAAAVIEEARDHGIDIRMLTGDHEAIARQVTGQLGMGQQVVAAADIFGASDEEGGGASEQRQRQAVLESAGFAEVTPEHKFDIVKTFQRDDRIVGMTGDGVNDAPALQQADVGVAVSSATDATRAAADLILTDQGLGVITHAVEEARRIFERMIGYATFRITESMRVLLFVSISILAFSFYPVTPIMIVLLAILNDIPIMTIAWDKVPTARDPVRWDMRRVLSLAAMLGIAGVVSSFLLFWYVETTMDLPQAELQTMFFLKLLVAGHMTIFLTRNQGWLWSKPLPALSLFLTLEGTQIAGTLVAVYGILVEPIGWALAGIVWGYALVWLLLLNAAKVLMLKLMNRGQAQHERFTSAGSQPTESSPAAG